MGWAGAGKRPALADVIAPLASNSRGDLLPSTRLATAHLPLPRASASRTFRAGARALASVSSRSAGDATVGGRSSVAHSRLARRATARGTPPHPGAPGPHGGPLAHAGGGSAGSPHPLPRHRPPRGIGPRGGFSLAGHRDGDTERGPCPVGRRGWPASDESASVL